MSDIRKAYGAFQAAKAAGDTEAARRIAGSIKKLQAAGATQQAPAPAAAMAGEAATQDSYTPAPVQQPESDSFGEVIQYGNDLVWKKVASTTDHLAPLAGKLGLEPWRVEGMARDFANFTSPPENYTPSQPIKDPEGAWYNPNTYNWSEVPKTIGEALPSFGYTALGAAGGPLGMAGSATLVGGTQTFGPTLDERMERKGLTDKSQLEGSDYAIAAGTSAANAVLERVGLGKTKLGKTALKKLENSGVIGKGIVKAADAPSAVLAKLNRMGRVGQVTSNVGRKTGMALREGAQESASSLAQQAGGSMYTPGGLDIRGNEAVVEGIAGMGTRAAVSAPGVAVTTVDQMLGPQYKSKRPKAAAGMANLMAGIAKDGKYATDDLTKEQYANETSKFVVKGTYQHLAEGIKKYSGMLRPLMEKDTELADLDFDNMLGVEGAKSDGSRITDPLDPEAVISINTAIRAGRNQHEGGISNNAIDLIAKKFGDFEEGRRLVEYLEMAEEYKRFHDLYRKGPTGGVLGGFWNSRPIKGLRRNVGKSLLAGGAGGAVYATNISGSAMAAPAMEPMTATAIGTGLGTLAAGAYALDKYTGRRNKVERLFSDYGSDKVAPHMRSVGISIADYNRYKQELSEVEGDARMAEEDARKVASDEMFKQAMVMPVGQGGIDWTTGTTSPGLTTEWLMENSSVLTDAHFKALRRRIDANDKQMTRQAKQQAKTAEQQQAAAQKAQKDALLKDLVDDWRGNRLDYRKLLAVRDMLTPQEYERFTTKQLQDDQRVVKFAYQMASQKAAEAEAEARVMEDQAKEFDKANMRLEAAAKREEAAEVRAEAARQAEDATQIRVDIESQLVLKQHDGTLQDTDVLKHKAILGPAKLKTWLSEARRIEDKRVAELAKKNKKILGLRVHRGAPKAPVDPMRDISKKVAAISAVAKMKQREMAAAERIAKSPVTRAEALGGARPVVSEGPVKAKSFQRSKGSEEPRNLARYNAKTQATIAMEESLLAQGAAILDTPDAPLGEAFIALVKTFRGTTKDNMEWRYHKQKVIADTLENPEHRAEFLRETTELTEAFGENDEATIANVLRAQEALRKTQARKASGADDVPF